MNDKHRKYEQRFDFHTWKGIERLLKQRRYMESRRFDGCDYTLSDIVIDMDIAIQRAELNDRQTEILWRLLVNDEDYRDISDEWGVSQQYISTIKKAVCVRIAEVYVGWNYGGLYA